jgi:hypothetical protein
LTYTLTVTNRGPLPASSVTVTDTLPANVAFVAASSPGVRTGSQVTWDLGALPGGGSTNLTITATPGAAGSLTNFAFVSSATSDTVPANNAATNVVAAYAPPTVLVAPTNQTALTGSSVSFYVSAGGTAPLSYQWQFDSSPLPGATASSLLLTNVQTGAAGSYSVVVSNLVGVATSVPALLAILSPSHILAQPLSRTVPQGGSATFEISAGGTGPLGYQWLFEGGMIASATGSVLALTNVQLSQAGNYSVIVTNIANAVTSSVANLRVLQTPDLAAVTKGGSEAGVSFLSVSGLVYTLQYKTSLEETNWISLPPPVIGNGETLQWYDTNAPAVSRFYRVLCE